MHPYLAEEFEFVEDSDPDVLLYSCFGLSSLRRAFYMPLVWSSRVKVFYTGEWVRPQMHRCHFAFSFCRDIESDSHFRLPHYVPVLDGHRTGLAGLVRQPGGGGHR